MCIEPMSRSDVQKKLHRLAKGSDDRVGFSALWKPVQRTVSPSFRDEIASPEFIRPRVPRLNGFGLDTCASPRNDGRRCEARCIPHLRILPVVPICRGPPRLILHPNQWLHFARLVPQRGALRDRHGRWEWDAMDAHRRARLTCATSGVCADGEVVWSWRSDAGAKVAELSAGDGGNQAWSPGRARRKPLKPLCRECRLLRCTCSC
jgi:hypothetical protein